ncbi:MAG: hypothetical protein JNK14_20710 [Chitinophagaceae bacterium]|nr:hypothetical protein [Chitinophagaceae bacterium]
MKSVKPLARRISIFLSVDSQTIAGYFNPHDPSPIYNRQLSYDFEEYLTNSVIGAKRFSTIRYKITCSPEDKKITDPLIQAIRRHFSIKKAIKEAEFRKFKKKAFILLGASILLVMICQGALPYVFGWEHRIHSAFSNALDVFSWVILWKPIERLIFYWNPFLKDIALLEKLATAEVIVIEKNKKKNTHAVAAAIPGDGH